MKTYRYCVLALLFALASVAPVYAQETGPNTAIKPFIMPVPGESGPSTWLVSQPYGNTTGAYATGASQYSAGQYLHFGVDISMACGTQLVAVADGVVGSVDNPYRGSAPHNLSLNFPDLGLSVLYGHLLERPALVEGQAVQQGDPVALSGDPDETCEGRPHLHFEVRSIDQSVAYNPILFIDAPWHGLIGLGGRSTPLFQIDLMNPRRWMTLEDQPDVVFGGRRLNAYTATWPSEGQRGVPDPTRPDAPFTPIDPDWTLRQIGSGGCCGGVWWNPARNDRVYLLDGPVGQLASVVEVDLGPAPNGVPVQEAPPPVLSADGTHELVYEANQTIIRRIADGAEWAFAVPGARPALSPDNRRLMWSRGDDTEEIWVAALDGSESRMVWTSQDSRASARWLDGARLLISEREPVPGRYTMLSVVNVEDGTSYPLGTWHSIRSLRIAPGGARIIFHSTFSPDPANDGAYALETAPGAAAQKLPWFADYRWRDAESVYFVTFNPVTDIHRLYFYHVTTGEIVALTDPETTPFTISNADWSVSPDGSTIAFQEARDDNLYVLTTPRASVLP